ncbi:DEAD/DEAH box helicase family protein [Caballeronia novacaledonica]|uniref:DEAD/DEAH box helicase family protein n=1 Tax=Caballeronia novacaledonica TaxID=1544861 RepID=A0ACB5R5P7_9BURK|nr:DEAD/DEAH box helicase [Caballeronia sp. LZ029]MDR5746992.1 helicase C-terminal domain-containing protein [Caballeronia sp. LZ029]GJH22668.1 DEAD/DEAH box helicase family protein [Caballeronia novacaledonica]
MAFKTPPADTTVADSPEKLFRDLTRRRLPDVLQHQAEIMRQYAAQAIDAPDVALQLPTGSGKTLVGLLVGEWRRRKFRERVVYLCPTRQLVHQVAAEANEKYGLSVATFVGRQAQYEPRDKTDYQQASRMAVTTYAGMFNTNTFFNNADIILVDDAHVSENYIAGHWTIKISRLDEAQAPLHQAISGILEPHLSTTDLTRLRGVWEDVVDRTWVDKIPTPVLSQIADQLTEVLDVHTDGTELAYPWSLLRGHLLACHLYVSSQDILIRPLLPPTYSHRPFAAAKQRIFMSATLGAGGDLERLTGRNRIVRVRAPEGWDRQGVGRRFFVFPSLSLTDEQNAQFRQDVMRRAGRSVVLVPSDGAADAVEKKIDETLKFPVFRARDIEQSKTAFARSEKAVAIVANRYDGVDFPGDECRLLLIDGLPKAVNSQERFLMSRMGANVLYNERVQTRVIQAIGRCTRSLEDYSAVVVTGDALPEYLADINRRRYLHPELQAEIAFGVNQSTHTDIANLLENIDIFLKNGPEWEDANRQIVDDRARLVQEALPAQSDLAGAVGDEIQYQTLMWRQDYQGAAAAAEAVLARLVHPLLKGYRALWNYLAGSAAYLAAQKGSGAMTAKARQHYAEAYKCAPDLSWLADFARSQHIEAAARDANDLYEPLRQVERLSAQLARLGTIHERDFARLEQEILSGLQRPETFERAQEQLGSFLGFVAGKREEEGSPDPWWISGNGCIVFEDYVDTDATAELDVKKTRQAASHPNWMKQHVEQSVGCSYFPTVVTPARKIRNAATPHAGELLYWEYDDFVAWAAAAIATVRELRETFFDEGDLDWQARAAHTLRERGFDFASIVSRLSESKLLSRMQAV